MRIANRSMNVQPTASRSFPQFTPARVAPRGRAVVDAFEAAPSAMKPARAQDATEPRASAALDRVLELITVRLGALLERLLAKLVGGAQPAQPVAPTPPAPAPVVTAGPQPTPLAGDVPNQVAYVNTIQNPRVAPKSAFRDVVNQAIDAVRAKGIGVDAQEPDRITNYDAYHQGVVSELRARGYNAAYDGEELAVGRAHDSFSEQFDISTASGLVRRFYAAWVSPPVWG